MFTGLHFIEIKDLNAISFHFVDCLAAIKIRKKGQLNSQVPTISNPNNLDENKNTGNTEISISELIKKTMNDVAETNNSVITLDLVYNKLRNEAQI